MLSDKIYCHSKGNRSEYNWSDKGENQWLHNFTIQKYESTDILEHEASNTASTQRIPKPNFDDSHLQEALFHGGIWI